MTPKKKAKPAGTTFRTELKRRASDLGVPSEERKLASSARPIPRGDKLHERFDEMRANAHDEWKTGKGLVLSGKKPEWKDADAALLKFKAHTPEKI